MSFASLSGQEARKAISGLVCIMITGFSGGMKPLFSLLGTAKACNIKIWGLRPELVLDMHSILLLASVKQYSLGCCDRWAQSQIWVVKQ